MYDCTYLYIYPCVHGYGYVLVDIHMAKCMFVVPVGMHVVEGSVEIESWTGNAGGDSVFLLTSMAF